MSSYNDTYEQSLIDECEKSCDPHAAYKLVDTMQQISEEMLCAGWITGNEYMCWDILQGKTLNSDEYSNDLKYYSNNCQGWWIWVKGTKHPTFVNLEQWKIIYEKEYGTTPIESANPMETPT